MMAEDEQPADANGVMIDTPFGQVMYVAPTPCDTCGSEAIGVLAPASKDVPGAYEQGIPLCEDHYDGDSHYDDDGMFVWHSLQE